MTNYYKKAIEILSVLQPDQAITILYRIAATRPGALVASFDQLDDDELLSLKLECSGLIAEGKKVAAVRSWRNKTGASLSDAVDAVESLGVPLVR